MALRVVFLLVCGLLLACDSATGPGVDEWRFEPTLQQSLVSADLVKTVLMRDGTVYSWGEGSFGTLGQGNLKSLEIPTKVPGLERVLDYTQDGGMAFALTEDGSLYQWGHYMFSSAWPHPNPKPARAARIVGAVSIFASVWRLYVVDESGALWKVEPSPAHPSRTPVPQQIPRPKRVVQVSGGVGLYKDGTLFSLEGLEPDRGGSVATANGIVAVQNSFTNTVALKANGTVWAWGHDGDCGLGDGLHMASQTPIRVPGLTGIRKISMSSGFRLAVKEDGTVWHWGYRGWDENHKPICQTTPAQLPRIVDAVDASAHWEALIQGANGNLYVFDPKTLKVTNVPFQ